MNRPLLNLFMVFSIIFFNILIYYISSVSSFELKKLKVDDTSKIENLIFIDARPVKVWEKGHIPKARSFSWETYTHTDSKGIKYRHLPPVELAKALGKMGISNKDSVAVYADADTSWGGEGWAAWILALLGHKGRVYILDGGFSLWVEKGYKIEQKSEKNFNQVEYITVLQPQMNIDAADIKKAGKSINLVDTRSYLTEWLPGHIPGAVSISWDKFYTGKHRQILPKEKLKALLMYKDVDLNKPVIYYCTGGIRSGFAWMVHRLAGYDNVKNFEGGIEEWNKYDGK